MHKTCLDHSILFDWIDFPLSVHCFGQKHWSNRQHGCKLFYQKHVTSISTVFFNVTCKNTDQNSMPVWWKNSKSVLILCSVQKHIKYTDNDFTMFGAKTLAELCLSETNVFSNVLALTINECLQWFKPMFLWKINIVWEVK